MTYIQLVSATLMVKRGKLMQDKPLKTAKSKECL